MRNYSRKTGKRVTRYRTPSSYRVRKPEGIKRMPSAAPPVLLKWDRS